jgi:hypothetical protein
MSRLRLPAAITTACLALAASARADVYYVKSAADLQLTEGALPSRDENAAYDYRNWQRRPFMQPYATLDGEGEIYVQPTTLDGFQPAAGSLPHPSIAVRTPAPRAVTGKLFLPTAAFSGMTAVKFTIPAEAGKEDLRNSFLETKLAHYRSLLERDIPGGAWFRHEVRETSRQLGRPDENPRNVPGAFNGRGDSVERSYALMSGGRAISENLQLDRMLPQAQDDQATVPLDSIPGITVRAFDWKPLVKDANPERDPLAALIPDDQYALLFPSFEAFVNLADHVGEEGAAVLRAASPRSEDALVRQRYERQLGLALNQASRLLGPAMVDGIALTGADPYLRTGADLAVLFQTKDPAALRAAIAAQVAASASSDHEAKPVQGDVAGVPYSGFRSPDRTVCSYIAALPGAVVVANSPTALERIVKASNGQLPALDKLDEYTFFRDRYQRGGAAESALLILSDKTIRKWCGPGWRIAASRRMRAAAIMAELQAAHLDDLVAGRVAPGPLHTDLAVPDVGSLTLGPAGVRSSAYGTLEFLTPIVELAFDKVTKSEKDFYERWRAGYERNWSNFFDPIAVRLHATPEKLAVDLTVMPLINFSDYRHFVSISRGAKIDANSGDPHPGSLVHAILAVNTEAEPLKQGANMAATMVKVDPLSWVGQSAALYLDNDPLWAELAGMKDGKSRNEFIEANLHRLPVAANIEVKNGLKLVAFLAGARTFIEQSAPGMTVWETLAYRELPYVKVSLSQSARRGMPWDKVALYYAPGGDALVVSLSLDVLQRALDRQIERREAQPAANTASNEKPSSDPQPPASSPQPSTLPWLGENLCWAIDGQFIQLLKTAFADAYQRQIQQASWANLAALNEWHARYPGQDPVALHQKFWDAKLVCPGGGQYRWNDQWQTMESTVYGHPGEPRGLSPRSGALPALLDSLSAANFGHTFEADGLRARVELTRRTPAGKSP